MTILYALGCIIVQYSVLINYELIQDREVFFHWFFLFSALMCLIWYKSQERINWTILIACFPMLYGVFIIPIFESLSWVYQLGGYTLLSIILWFQLKIIDQHTKVSLSWDIYEEGKKEYKKQKLRRTEIWNEITGR